MIGSYWVVFVSALALAFLHFSAKRNDQPGSVSHHIYFKWSIPSFTYIALFVCEINKVLDKSQLLEIFLMNEFAASSEKYSRVVFIPIHSLF